MNRQEIEQTISHLQSEIKRRASTINCWNYYVATTLKEAKYFNDVLGWRDYHNTKDIRNSYVKDQVIQKKMLKHFYMIHKNYERELESFSK